MAFEQIAFTGGVLQGSPAFGGIGAVVQTLAQSLEILKPDRVTRPYLEELSTLVVRDASGRILCGTDHFLLSMMVETDQEKSSARFTLGDPVLYLAKGRHLRMYSYSGFLVDSLSSGPGISSWLYIYDKYLRGTRCVERGAVAELETRKLYRKGYINSTMLAVDATNPQRASLSFTMFVIEEKNK